MVLVTLRRPDFLAEILQAETAASPASAPAQPSQALVDELLADAAVLVGADQSFESDDEDDLLVAQVDHSLQLTDLKVDDNEEEEDEEDDGTL